MILFAPSEAKTVGGEPLQSLEDAFLFPEVYPERLKAWQTYQQAVSKLPQEKLEKMTGLKQVIQEDLIDDLEEALFKKAVQRYSGVAYQHLDYDSLPAEAQLYIDASLLIFSNLFGPVRAADPLPHYKLKQGEKIDGFAVETHYRKCCSEKLDSLLSSRSIVVDLRAGYYEKFYVLTMPHFSYKFLKNGKVVSHYAKAYRGIVLRRMAEENVQTPDELGRLEVEGLKLLEIRETGVKTELLMEVQN